MNLRRYTFWLPVLLVLLLLLGLLGWALSSSRSTPISSVCLAKVTFAGYSNAPEGQVIAWFTVTNPTDYRILYCPASVEMRSGDQWPMPSHNGREKELAPHASISVSIPKPAVGETWRVTTFNGLAQPTWQPFVEKLTWFIPGARTWLDRKYPICLGPSSSEPRTD